MKTETIHTTNEWQVLSCIVDKGRLWNFWHFVVMGERIQFSVNVKSDNPDSSASLTVCNVKEWVDDSRSRLGR
jgi:hypothetical protein